ncbi:peroxin 13 [Trichoderma citrinoviride]|uniref:Peroxisomal membrane protein PEX13 n=1 Tax=Trichoderma citrinoviride TaxID=58853 RepID=A0A2T4BHN2_9HYPO|nr:peroxin 13 [Trichoderma citrinoviride]PTB68834.1 peroxin 13 [Trichoderma citrinoviride]
MASPPKPWERAGAGPVPSLNIPSSPASSSAAPLSPASSVASMEAPPIPERPASLAASINQNAAAHTRVGAMGAMGAMGASPYGAYNSAYSSPYSSPYSRFGGGYGGYGSMYGGMPMGGMGGMYGGGMYGGMPMGDPNSLANRFSNGTAATFQMLEGVVTAFGGFAQMLESTYMATHSSFFAMISVAEQFSNLRDTLGSLLGIFTLIRWIRTVLAKLTGRPLPADAASLNPSDFARFQGRSSSPGGSPQPPKASRKPLLFFLLAAFGLPYLMSKLIKSITANAEEEEKRLEMQALEAQKPVDPAKLEFCRLRFDFTPQQPNGMELEARKGDLVAVLSKNDPAGQPSEWWHCRSRDGRQGYLPSTYLEVLKRSSEPKKLKAAPDSRTNSLTSSSTSEEGKKEYATADGMQRSHFYS